MTIYPYSVLLVDDDTLVANSLGRMLRRQKLDVSICPYPERALKMCERYKFDLIITDQRMPGMNGTDFAIQLKEKQSTARVILISGYSDNDKVIEAFNKEAINRHVCKPWDNEELMCIINEQLHEVGANIPAHNTERLVY